MATTKNVENTVEKETIFIPRAAENEDPNLFVCINGVNYILPKGKDSTVPVFVAEEIRRSRQAELIADERRAAMLKAAQ